MSKDNKSEEDISMYTSDTDESSSESSSDDGASAEKKEKIKKIIELRTKYERIKKANEELAAIINANKNSQPDKSDEDSDDECAIDWLDNAHNDNENDTDPSGQGSNFDIDSD